MDSNGLHFWIASRESDWRLPREVVHHDGCLRLASLRAPGNWGGARAGADRMLAAVPPVLDAQGRIGFVERAGAAWNVKVRRPAEAERDARLVFASDREITSISCGTGGLFFAATAEGVLIRDLHPSGEQRFPPTLVANPELRPFRLAADPAGGCWVLGAGGEIGRIDGSPFPELARQRFAPEIVRPLDENVAPPVLRLWDASTRVEAPASIAAIAYSPESGIALARWNDGADAELLLPGSGRIETLPGMPFPCSMRWLDAAHLAILFPGAQEVAVYEIGRGFSGDYYPLHGGASSNVFFESIGAGAEYEALGKRMRVERISLPSLATSGTAELARGFDSGEARTVWHRLYVEASFPSGCAVTVWAAASQSADARAVTEWHPHLFGHSETGKPCGTWMPEPSEVPFHHGLLVCPRVRGSAGLFMVLLQRTARTVSSLTGRYLHLRIELRGAGQATPEIAAIRAYASRFSYAERYLPELYRETSFGADADLPAQQPGAPDFLNRFLCLFESYLTPLEDRVANAYLLTRPATAPADSIEWLAAWLGVSFDPALPIERRREWLAAAPELHRWRGTLTGLSLALDIASGGGVRGGEIVIVENYRLRRVLATILGVDLSECDDPLLPGTHASGNSIVGDTLILSDESRRDVLALFDASVKAAAAEADAIDRLSDQLAHRVTVLVHQEVEPRSLGVIRRVAEREKPAHVQLTLTQASTPFLAGITSLVGVDTYLAGRPKPGAVRVDRSELGVWDVVRQEPGLDTAFPG